MWIYTAKNTTTTDMEAKKFIEPVLENRKVVIMASLDVKRAFDAAWWPSILKGLKTQNALEICITLVKDTSVKELQ